MTHVAHSSDSEPWSPDSPGLLERPVSRLSPGNRRMLAFVTAGVPIGLLAGLLWQAVAGLPGYTVAENGSATMTERGLAGFFSADFWFVVIGVVLGAAIGAWGWRWFGRRGWVVVPLVLAAAAIAALLCWWLGTVVGPSDFDERLGQAVPGEVVSIDLELRARAALAAWPFGAILPVMIASAFFGEPPGRSEGWRSEVSEPAMPGGPRVTGQSTPSSDQRQAPDRDGGEQ
ncbi:hypothetical protein ACPCG0_01715 [Propionibacteriaceae bacterium Y1923]|uniref:hypothetical protein n=1 Tax=Aestuariimicrobium sp. Y1814 TaxID=3418742 RepID=UPI003C26FCCD